ncbi:MAG: PadR family transcriptional regulator [Chloroflexota bacterium]
MYEFMILGRLSRGSMHGYLIAKILESIIGPYRQIQWGALYPVLKRMEGEGLITSEGVCDGEDGRSRKVFSITDAGRERLHEHLMDTESHLQDYPRVFLLKLGLFDELTEEERVRLCRHYAVYCQRFLDHLDRKRRKYLDPAAQLAPEQVQNLLLITTHDEDHWSKERDWAEELIVQQTLQEAI